MYDAERLVADYLRAETGARVVARPPNDRDTAWVQLVEITAPQDPTSKSDHSIEHYFQIDCYAGKDPGGGPPEANALGGDVRKALVALNGVLTGDLDTVVVTKTEIAGDGRNWDPEMTPARDRRVITASVWMHA